MLEVTLRDNGKKRVRLTGFGKSKTEQHHKEICDINHILRRYKKTGFINHVNSMKAFYSDFTNVGSYHEAMNKLLDTQDAFMRLPAGIRKEFDNDPGLLLEAVTDPAQKDRMIELGLLPRDMDVSEAKSPVSEAVQEESAQSST